MKGWVPYKMRYFRFERDIFFIVIFQSTLKPKWSVSLFQWDRRSNLIYKKNYAIITNGYTDVDIQLAGRKIFMAVSISYNNENKLDDLRLYEWDKTQFDLRADEKLKSIHSVKLFTISSVLFLVTTQINSYSAGSILFTYNYGSSQSHDSKLVHRQVIPSMKSIKVEHFVVNRNVYLIFIGSQNAKIYWINGHELIEYQTLDETAQAIDVAILNLPNSEALISLLFSDHVRFYTETEDAEYRETSKRLDLKTYNVKVSAICFHADTSNVYRAYLAMAYNSLYSSSYTSAYFSPIWYLSIEPYYRRQSQDPLVMCLQRVTSLLNSRMEKLNEISKKVIKVWTSNRAQTVTAPINVQGRTVIVGKANLNQVKLQSRSLSKSNATNSQIKYRLEKIHSSLSFMNDELSDNLFHKSKPNQTIYGSVKFVKPLVASRVAINDLANDAKINGVRFSELSEKSLRKNKPQTITGQWSFSKTAYVDKLHLNGTLNKIRVSDIVYSNAQHEQVITGHLAFDRVRLKSQFAANKINGIPLSHFITTTNQKVQYITGTKKLDSVESRTDIRVMNTTNGRNLTYHIMNAIMLTNNSPQYLDGHIEFLDQLRVDNLQINGMINQKVNLTKMLHLGLQVDGHQTIYGTKTFSQISAQKVSLSGRLNGISVPDDLISVNLNQQVPGKIIFSAPVILKSNLQTHLINNIDLTRDVILRHSRTPQHIYGYKTFTNPMTVNENVYMKNYVTLDGVDLSQIYVKARNLHKSIFDRSLIFDDLTVAGNVSAFSSVNNLLIQNLPRMLWSKSKPQVISVGLTFDGPVDVDWLQVDLINQHRFPRDFVVKNSRHVQYIVQPKSFTEMIFRDSTLIPVNGVHVNGIDLNSLQSRLILNSPNYNQTNRDRCYGHKMFTYLDVRGNIYAKTVNYVDINREVMLTNQQQVVNASFTFNAPVIHIDQLQTRDLIIQSTLLTSNISYWLSDVVLKSRGRVTLSNKHFDHELTLNKLNTNGTINGVNLNTLLNRAVNTNTNQVIKGPIVFKNSIYFNKPIRVRLINGYDLLNHTSKLVLKSNPRPVSGEKIIQGKVTIDGHLFVDGLINGINLTDLTLKAASKTEKNVFTSPVVFANFVNIDRLQVTHHCTLDGVPFNQMVLLNSNSHIMSKVIIKNSIRVDNNLTVLSNTIGGCNLTRLVKDSLYVTSPNPQYLNNFSRFHLLKVLGNVIITSNYINKINIRTLASRLINLSSNQVVNTSLTFKDHVTVDNLIIRSLFNNMDINNLLADCVQRSAHQTIKGHKVFEQSVVVKTGPLVLNGDINFTGLVNGINLAHLNQSLVTTDGNFKIRGVKKLLQGSRLIFENDVHLQEPSIGGIKLQDIVLIHSNDTIPYSTIFRAPLYAKRDLTLLGTLNGRNWTNVLTSAISLTRNEVIQSDLVLNDLATIDRLFVRKTINNIPIRSLLTRNGNNYITGNYHFRDSVTVYGNVDMAPNSTINNVDLRNLVTRQVNIFKPELVTGTVVFNDVVELRRGITVDALNGNNPGQLKTYYTNYTRQVRDAMIEYSLKAAEQNRLLQNNYENALSQKIQLEYFDTFLDFDYMSEDNRKVLIDRFIHSPFMRSSAYLSRYGYGPLYPYLYAWRIDKKYECPNYSTLVYKILDDGRLTEKSSGYQNGRAFPVIQYLQNSQVSFSAWTNSSDCPSVQKRSTYYSPYSEITQIKTITLDTRMAPDQRRSLLKLKHVSLRTSSTVSSDFKYFNDGHNMYVVVAYSYNKVNNSAKTDTIVFRFDPVDNKWVYVQKIPTFGASSLDLIYYEKEKTILLAICNRFISHKKFKPTIVLRWIKEREQFTQIGLIQTSSPSDVMFLETAKGDELFLIISNSKEGYHSEVCRSDEREFDKESGNSYLVDPVYVYYVQFARGRKPSLRFVQILNYESVNSIDCFHLPPEDTYLVLASKSLGKTFVLKLRGFQLFQELINFPSPGVEDVQSYWSNDGNLFLALASSIPGQSKILKTYMSGPPPSRKLLKSFH